MSKLSLSLPKVDKRDGSEERPVGDGDRERVLGQFVIDTRLIEDFPLWETRATLRKPKIVRWFACWAGK